MPGGTVGGRMAGTWNPRRSSCALAASAAPSSPTGMGMMGDTARRPVRRPKRVTFAQRRVWSEGSAAAAASAALAPATQERGRAVE